MKLGKNKYLPRAIVICCLTLIVVNIWGINSCFDAAKRNRDRFINNLEYVNYRYPMVISMPSDRPVRENIQLAGLEGNPHLFTDGLVRIMLVFTICIILSVFVLYGTMQLHQQSKDLAEARLPT